MLMLMLQLSSLAHKFLMLMFILMLASQMSTGLRAGSHFDISISISINISIRKVCVSRDYISISIRMANAQAQFTSHVSKMAENEVEIGLLLLLRRGNPRRLLMQRQTQRKPWKIWIRYIFMKRKTQGDYYNLVL